MRLLARTLAALTVSLPVVAVPVASVNAETLAPCIPGTSAPLCHFWDATVDHVSDGDTLVVDIAGDGTSDLRRVRVTGINAQEMSVYSTNPANRRGECHALAANARFEELVRASGSRIRLVAQDPASTTGSRQRLRRSVWVKLDGRWRDVAKILVREGHAVWLPNQVEYARNAMYARLAKSAWLNRRGIWDTDACGAGPHQDAQLELFVNWDAEGYDGDNVNGELVRIQNHGSSDVPLGGWTVRDSLHRLSLPAGTVAPAGGSLMVYVGSGTSTTTRVYWNRSTPIFENVTDDATAMGDGAYLFDPDGDMRYWMSYPCVGSCADSLQGKIEMTAQPSGDEYVYIRNTSTTSVDLDGYVLVNEPYSYPFRSTLVLEPGKRLRLYVEPGRDTYLTLFWGKTSNILNNGGDSVSLRRHDDVMIDCYRWGDGVC